MGRQKLGRITKEGDSHVPSLRVHKAIALLATAAEQNDPINLWALQTRKRRDYGRALVAIAAKMHVSAGAIAPTGSVQSSSIIFIKIIMPPRDK